METARLFFGLTAAVLIPWGQGWQGSRPRLMVFFTLMYGGYAVVPYIGESRPRGALIAVTLISLGAALCHSSSATPSAGFSLAFPLSAGTWTWARRMGVAALGAAMLLLVWAAGPAMWAMSTDLIQSDGVAIFLSALLVSVFTGGVLAKVATRSVRQEILGLPDGPGRTSALEFMTASREIGLLERGLLYAFLAAGRPDAAGLVLAAKTFARSPHHERHAADYFLLGTLSSVIASLAMSMAARAAVGLPAL